MSKSFGKLLCKRSELQLKGTLNGGQSFRWKQFIEESKERWIGVFNGKVWVLTQEDEHIDFEVYEKEVVQKAKKLRRESYDDMLRNYFQLNLSLEEHFRKWSEVDPYFKEASQQFYGIRILKQDVTENIFSFICSSNNNISRISGMVEKLAKFYGTEICEVNGQMFYAFPSVASLASPDVEKKLRDSGFGYRAKYIATSATHIQREGGEMWLDKLKEMDYADAKKSLMQLTGVGAKVADCICLMSLGHLQAIPVDTHIYQIAARLYMPKLAKKKTVTEKIYNEIGDHFRNLYGPLAGWAHTVLFCADLKKFQNNKNEDPVK